MFGAHHVYFITDSHLPSVSDLVPAKYGNQFDVHWMLFICLLRAKEGSTYICMWLRQHTDLPGQWVREETDQKQVNTGVNKARLKVF